MRITLTKLGRNISIAFDAAQTTQSIIYDDSANVEMTFNPLSKIVSISVKGGETFNTDPVDSGTNSLYVNAGIAYDDYVLTEGQFNDAYAALFPKEGGGSGTTPTLQAVTAAGDNTNLRVEVFEDGNNQKHIALETDPLSKSGILVISHQDGFKTKILRDDNTASNDVIYRLPDKLTNDTFAMITDIPYGGPYAAAITNAINLNYITRDFTQYGRIRSFDVFPMITVYFQFKGEATASGKCSFEIGLPFPAIGKGSFGIGGAGTAKILDSFNEPIFIITGSDQDRALIEFFAKNANDTVEISGCFNYGYFF